jgi:hypothetical protein
MKKALAAPLDDAVAKNQAQRAKEVGRLLRETCAAESALAQTGGLQRTEALRLRLRGHERVLIMRLPVKQTAAFLRSGFGAHQNSAAKFLNLPQKHQKHGSGPADRMGIGDKADERGGDSHQQQRHDQDIFPVGSGNEGTSPNSQPDQDTSFGFRGDPTASARSRMSTLLKSNFCELEKSRPLRTARLYLRPPRWRWPPHRCSRQRPKIKTRDARSRDHVTVRSPERICCFRFDSVA